MSEISVNRTAGGGRCLIIDGTRVAGAKPEFSSDNCVCWWQTNETIGAVDELEAENARLRELVRDMWRLLLATGNDDLVLSLEINGVVKEVIDADELAKTMRELGIEVG